MGEDVLLGAAMHRIVADMKIVDNPLSHQRYNDAPVVGCQADGFYQTALLDLQGPVQYPLGRPFRVVTEDQTIDVVGAHLGQGRF